MKKAVHSLEGGLIGTTFFSVVGVAQQASSTYEPSGPVMVFIITLVMIVIGGWVAYEWGRKNRAT